MVHQPKSLLLNAEPSAPRSQTRWTLKWRTIVRMMVRRTLVLYIIDPWMETVNANA